MEIRDSSRRLAAILFTDIVGYTAMMQQDEKLAMVAVRKHHEIIQRCVPQYGGDIHQYFGDGCMCIFNSATDAVSCAMQFQLELLQQPEVLVRTGIHIGEIYLEGGKIFGDSVNLASRIESIGQGGTVLFSRDVYEKIRNHPEFQVKSLGTFEFKNVNDPLEVHALVNPGLRIPDKRTIEGKLKEQKKRTRRTFYLSLAAGCLLSIIILALYFYPNDAETAPGGPDFKSSIAVLPFDNLSGNPEDEFLSTGLAEDILTQLAQIDGLKVIGRTSSSQYKNYEEEGKTLAEVAKELGVTNILEGSVRKYDDVLRFTVRLINPTEGNVTWAKEFDRNIEDVLNAQREIALAVSDELQINLTTALRNRLENKDMVNPEAYLHYQKGMQKLASSSGSPQEVLESMQLFEKAIQADSGYAQAWIGYADACLESIFWHRGVDTVILPQAAQAASKALELDPGMGEAYGVMGTLAIYSTDINTAEEMLTKSISLSPSYAFAYERYGWLCLYTGKTDKGIEYLKKAIQLEPRSTRYKGSLGSAYYFVQRYDEGIQQMQSDLIQHPGDNFILWNLAFLYAGKGYYQRCVETLDLRTIGRKTNWVYAYCHSKLGNRQEAQTVLDTLIARSHRTSVPSFMLAAAHVSLGNHDEALKYLDQATESAGESYFSFSIGEDVMFAPLRDDPRFQAIVRRVQEQFSTD